MGVHTTGHLRVVPVQTRTRLGIQHVQHGKIDELLTCGTEKALDYG